MRTITLTDAQAIEVQAALRYRMGSIPTSQSWTLLNQVIAMLAAAEPVAPAGKYLLQIGRDARQYYTAGTNASLEDIKSRLTRHGYADEQLSWEDDGADIFDNVETFSVVDRATKEVVAAYSDGDGWDPAHD